MEAPAAPGSGRCKAAGPEPPAPTSLAGGKLDDVTCYICQDYLTLPVTIECGHNFCRACITQRWEAEETPSCPRCGETVQKRDLRSNEQLGRLVQAIQQVGLNPRERRRAAGNVCAEHGKELACCCKEDAASPCADCEVSPAPRSHAGIPTAQAAHQPQEEANTSSRSEDGNVQDEEDISYRERKRKDKFLAELRWRVNQLYAVDVTLDPDTANPELVLSEDGKRVRRGDTRQDLPDNPARFDRFPCVLGAEGFSGGRRYWEVEVGDSPEWVLGVCGESVSRKRLIARSPGKGYWVLGLKDGRYKALNSPAERVRVRVRPSRVGISLDYEAGEVSFYNITARSRLFIFTDTFSGTLCPYFCLSVSAGGEKAAPLIICPVPTRASGNLSRDCPLRALISPQACAQGRV